MSNQIPGWKDKILFTPGPLTTSRTVKQALLRDLGSRDFEFISMVRDIRRRLVELGGVSEDEYTAVIMQGAGTFGLESVLCSTMPKGGKLLVVVNGSYGARVAKIAEVLNIETIVLKYNEDQLPDPADVDKALAADPDIFQVSMCSCETTSGIFNPWKEVGEVVAKHGRTYFVDAMSNFGATPMNLKECNIDYLVSSANKCVEGVPGFSFILCKRETLLKTEGWARSVSLNVLEQFKGLEKNGQFRFTPPTHALLAYHQALVELEQEGGVEGRSQRYQANYNTLVTGMRKLGFEEYLNPEVQGYIITSFRYPDDPNWDFEKFYSLLNEDDFVIYPGKVGNADCFRIGNIGRIFPSDVSNLVSAVERAMQSLGMQISKADLPTVKTLCASKNT